MVEGLAKMVSVEGGSVLLIRDCVACKGCFLLHYLLKQFLTETKTRVLMLGLVEPFSHYARIARKHGCNLQSMQDSGTFVCFDQLQLPTVQQSGTDGGAHSAPLSDNPLRGLYLKVREAAREKKLLGSSSEDWVHTCIMIDDVSVLDVMAGGNHNFVLEFLHYVRALKVGKQKCSVVLLTHQDVYEDPPASYMNLELEYAADTVLTVEPLCTGLAADVHGQVTLLHRTGQLEDRHSQMRSRSRLQKYQFRILEGPSVEVVRLFRVPVIPAKWSRGQLPNQHFQKPPVTSQQPVTYFRRR